MNIADYVLDLIKSNFKITSEVAIPIVRAYYKHNRSINRDIFYTIIHDGNTEKAFIYSCLETAFQSNDADAVMLCVMFLKMSTQELNELYFVDFYELQESEKNDRG